MAKQQKWPMGRTVVGVRRMSAEELEEVFWQPRHHDGPVTVIEFDDGSFILASADEEGNGPGELYYKTPDMKEGYYGILMAK